MAMCKMPMVITFSWKRKYRRDLIYSQYIFKLLVHKESKFCGRLDYAMLGSTRMLHGHQFKSQLLNFDPAPSYCTQEGNRWWPKCWGACTHLGDRKEATGSWLWFGTAPGHCGSFRSDPASGKLLPLSVNSVFQIHRHIFYNLIYEYDKH